jgi:anti-sigma factor RsiW
MRCRRARITMALASELPARTRRAVERHLEGCEGCRRERTAYAALDRALGLLPMESAVSTSLERAVARRVRHEGGDVSPARRAPWWLGVPAVAAAAVLALSVRGTRLSGDAPATASSPARQLAEAPPAMQLAKRHRAPGAVPRDPPPDLAARPDLFVDLPMLRDLERLEHFDAIQTTTLKDQDGGRSSG